MEHLFGTEPIMFVVSSEDRRKIEELKRSAHINFNREFHAFIEKTYAEHQKRFWGYNTNRCD